MNIPDFEAAKQEDRDRMEAEIAKREGEIAKHRQFVEKFKAKRVVEEAAMKQTYTELAEKVNGLEMTLNLRANPSNLLYGSFSSGDVVTQLNNRHINIEKSMVQLEESIKALGSYEVQIKFDEDISATLKVEILNEHGEVPELEEEIEEVVAEVSEDAAETTEEGDAQEEATSESDA